MMRRTYPTQHRLSELFRYDDKAGTLIRTVSRGGQKVGAIAGCPDKPTPRGLQYLGIRVDGDLYDAHTLVFIIVTGRAPDDNMVIDHVNRNGLDNRWKNLREVSQSQNIKNSRSDRVWKGKKLDPQMVGIYINKRGRWTAKLDCGGYRLHVGTYDDKHSAIQARRLKANELGVKLRYDP